MSLQPRHDEILFCLWTLLVTWSALMFNLGKYL